MTKKKRTKMSLLKDETKLVKAKYYKEPDLIVVMDPQPERVKGQWAYQRAGTDELGDWVVIDYITGNDSLAEYDTSTTQLGNTVVVNEITEDEWNKPATLDIENMDLLLSSNVQTVDVSTSQESHTTSLKTNPQIYSTETEKWWSIIVRLFLNVYAAITSKFRQ
jgi:hypothetical protein